MAINTDKLLKLSQFQTGLTAARDYTDSKVQLVNANITQVQTDLDTTKAKVEALEQGTYDDTELRGLINTNKTSIDTLNGAETAAGSVKKTVNDAINKFATDVTDDNVVNSYKELIDYVATHGGEAATMAADIAVLKTSTAGTIKKTDLSTTPTGTGNAVTEVTYDNATGKFTITKGATYLTEADVVINVATDAEVTAICNTVFGA